MYLFTIKELEIELNYAQDFTEKTELRPLEYAK